MRRFWRRPKPYPVIEELEKIQRECRRRGDQISARYVSDMLLYAHIGKDRKKLHREPDGPAYVAATRKQVEKWAALEAKLHV